MICKKHQPKECEDCIREEIKKLENKLSELKAKLPNIPPDMNQVWCGGGMFLTNNGDVGLIN